MKHIARTLGVLVATGGMFGCATTYQVKVAAMRSAQEAPRQTYRLVSAVEGRDLIDPQYADVALLVERALNARGLHAASRPEWADIEVRVDFGVGPNRLKAMSELVSGVATMVFLPEKSASPVSESVGAYVPASSLQRVVGVREKRLALVARENAMGGLTGSLTGPELWRVEVAIEDQSSSFAELLPVLAGALVAHIDSAAETDCVDRLSKEGADGRLLAQGF